MDKVELSTGPHKRGVKIMRTEPQGVHTGPSLWPRIWLTTEMDAHAYSILRQTPAAVPRDVFCPQNRQCATVCAAKSRTTALPGSSRSNARAESETQTVDACPTTLALACPCASVDYRVPHELW